MKKTILLGCLFCWMAIPLAHAKQPMKNGPFVGIDGIFGYESKQIKKAGFGCGGQVGYRFTERIAGYLQGDVFLMNDLNTTYEFIPIVPTVMYNFYDGVYAFLGAGYEWLHVSDGIRFGGVPLAAPTNYSGWTVESGVGYEFWIQKMITIAPQLGFNFARVAQSNIYIPNGRLNINYHF